MATTIRDVLHQFYSLVQNKLEGSINILGDFLLSNSSELGLKTYPQHHYRVAFYYADSLYASQHFKRALNYYEQALKILKQLNSSENLEDDLSEAGVRWRMYKCHMDLKQVDEALTVLVLIPQEERDAKVWTAMAKLFQQLKSDSHSAAACYKQCLRKCPLAMEAVFGLLALGYALTDVLSPTAAAPAINGLPGNVATDATYQQTWSALKNCHWLYEWLEAESMILQRNYSGAVMKFDELTRKGLKLSADGNCQLAFCMEKLGRKESAKEFFAIASCQDVHVIIHMDVYARLLATGQSTSTRCRQEKLEKICSQLMSASCLHSEPWVAQSWLVLSSKGWIANIAIVQRNIKKAVTIRPSAEAAYVEGLMYSKLGDLTSAAARHSEALRLDSSFFEAYRDLIQCYLKWKPRRMVMNTIEMASKSLPAAQHFYLEGVVWFHYLAHEKAAKMLKKCLLEDSSFEDAALLLGNVYCKMGQVKMTAKVLLEQLSASSSGHLHIQLARALMQLGQHQEALDHFQRALYLDPELKEAKEGKEKLLNSLSPGIGAKEEEQNISKEEQEGVLTPFQAHTIRGQRPVDIRS